MAQPSRLVKRRAAESRMSVPSRARDLQTAIAERQQQPESEAETSVHDDMEQHGHRLPSGSDRNALEGKDDEPEHQNRSDRAEQEGREIVHRAVRKPALDHPVDQ